MRYVSFYDERGHVRPGLEIEGAVVDLLAADPTLPTSVREILAASVTTQVMAAARKPAAPRVNNPRFAPPIADPEKIFCIGLNYRDHAAESGMAIPEEPVVFCKFRNALVGHEAGIRLPAVSQQVDYEAELVVVVGKSGRDIPRGRAMEHVAGYMVGHDVSARDWQLNKPGGQWLLGKTFDTFAPTGPLLTTADEVPDPHALRVRLRLNGETMQDSSTSQLIFKLDELISYLSQVASLSVGDLIFTGTPPGVGFARKPQVFLKPGDVCEVEIDGLGTLRNRCVAA